MTLSKVYYADNPRFITIYIRPCMNEVYCADEPTHKQYIQELADVEGAIFLLVYFLDDVISPQSKNPVSYTINTDVELAFTPKRGIIATV